MIGCKTKSLSVSALSDTDTDDDPLAWLLLDQHALTPEQTVYRQVCTEELEQLFRTLSAKDRAILGHTYGVFGYEKLSADELGLREMLSPDGVTKARKAALERLRSRYPGSGLHLWRDVSCAERYFRYLTNILFLNRVFKDAVFKEKGQRKIPLAPTVYSRGYEVFISGICLKKLRSEQHETNLK